MKSTRYKQHTIRRMSTQARAIRQQLNLLSQLY